MPWVVGFIVSWVLFLLLTDYKNLKKNIIAGFLALFLATFVDWGGQALKLYIFRDPIVPFFSGSAFYKLGPIFTMGTLYAQSVPRNKWLQALNILVFSLVFLALETLTIAANAAEYINWCSLASFTVNVLAFGTLTWFTKAFLRNGREREMFLRFGNK